MEKACVILGAGASWDCHSGGTGILDKRWQPPLAKDLFSIDANLVFEPILKHYPGARDLAQELALKVPDGVVALEQLLRFYANSTDKDTRERFKEIPPYLRDIIGTASRAYTELPGTHMTLVHGLLKRIPHEVLFLVLNYDTLLEQALQRWMKVSFVSIEDYVWTERRPNPLNTKVVKLHGSVNWFTPMRIGADWRDAVRRVDVDRNYIKQNGIVVINNDAGRSENMRDPDGLFAYPVLTVPVAGKALDASLCPDDHLGFAQSFLTECRKFLIAGTRGLDDDLMTLLEENVSKDRPPEVIHYVGATDNDIQETRSNFEEKVPVLSTGKRANFHRGFKDYVSRHLDSFLMA